MKSTEGWLCIRFTHLALNSAGIALHSRQPAAITDSQQIWQCNLAAIKTGIKPAMSVNHALMLAPELSLLERDSQAEAKKLHDLSFWAYRFSSLVNLYNDHSLLLEIGRSIKLFNGLNHLLHLVNNDLASFRIATHLGIAHTPKGAYLSACGHQDSACGQHESACGHQDSACGQQNSSTASLQAEACLARLQQSLISDLEIEAKTIGQLHNCGFETLQDIESIPYAELGQRFGAGLLDYLDQLQGRKPDPQTGITPPETFQASADFAEPISNLTWINQQLDRLLGDLQQFISNRQLLCRSFTWRFFHENNRLLQTVTIGLSAKQNKFDTFRELTDLKLGNMKLDWEFSSIELSSTQLVPIRLFNNDLFDPQPDQQQFNQLIDKLANRLGDSALYRINIEAEHLPELANGRRYAVEETGPANSYPALLNNAGTDDPENDGKHKHQPLWLLENPQRLAQQQRQPLHEGPLNLIHGPDRITSHWWSKLQSRDYFIARQRNGRLLWVFFDRGSKQWFLHGLFA